MKPNEHCPSSLQSQLSDSLCPRYPNKQKPQCSIKGTVMHTEKALTNDCLHVLKVS